MIRPAPAPTTPTASACRDWVGRLAEYGFRPSGAWGRKSTRRWKKRVQLKGEIHGKPSSAQ